MSFTYVTYRPDDNMLAPRHRDQIRWIDKISRERPGLGNQAYLGTDLRDRRLQDQARVTFTASSVAYGVVP